MLKILALVLSIIALITIMSTCFILVAMGIVNNDVNTFTVRKHAFKEKEYVLLDNIVAQRQGFLNALKFF